MDFVNKMEIIERKMTITIELETIEVQALIHILDKYKEIEYSSIADNIYSELDDLK